MDDLDRRALGRGPRWLAVTLGVLGLTFGALGVVASWLSFSLEDGSLWFPVITTVGFVTVGLAFAAALRRR